MSKVARSRMGIPLARPERCSPPASFTACSAMAATVDVLRRHDVAFHAVDVLSDPALRQGIKTYSDWPTVPQLYIGGAFVGGCDIVREMHETGELGELFASSNVSAATDVA